MHVVLPRSFFISRGNFCPNPELSAGETRIELEVEHKLNTVFLIFSHFLASIVLIFFQIRACRKNLCSTLKFGFSVNKRLTITGGASDASRIIRISNNSKLNSGNFQISKLVVQMPILFGKM